MDSCRRLLCSLSFLARLVCTRVRRRAFLCRGHSPFNGFADKRAFRRTSAGGRAVHGGGGRDGRSLSCRVTRARGADDLVGPLGRRLFLQMNRFFDPRSGRHSSTAAVTYGRKELRRRIRVELNMS